MKLLQTPTFIRNTKHFHPNQTLSLQQALEEILRNPNIGEAKTGDLIGVRVYKFKILDQVILVAYKIINSNEIWLLSCGSHENFYKNLKLIM